MIKFELMVCDEDSGELVVLDMPCNIKEWVDPGHSLSFIDWDCDLPIALCDDICKLNDIIEDINAENPAMTTKLLSMVFDASGSCSIEDEEFLRKINTNDFMLEKVDTKNSVLTPEEVSAKFLVQQCEIPFAKNITNKCIAEINSNTKIVNWEAIWKYYKKMGFKIIKSEDETLYVFHWGDAQE